MCIEKPAMGPAWIWLISGAIFINKFKKVLKTRVREYWQSKDLVEVDILVLHKVDPIKIPVSSSRSVQKLEAQKSMC